MFPVKCNHDRELITAILEAGQPYGFGLEVCFTLDPVTALARVSCVRWLAWQLR